MADYPHMCRDGHDEIGYRTSGEDERCPLCRKRDATARLVEAAREVALRVSELASAYECYVECHHDAMQARTEEVMECVNLTCGSVFHDLRAALAEVERAKGEG